MSGIITDNVGRSSGLVKSAGGGGTILSVKSMKYTDTLSNSGTAPTQISAFDMSFAATESDSKLYFQACLNISSNSNEPTAGYFYDVTNTTIIGAYGDAASVRLRCSWGSSIRNSYSYSPVAFGTWHEPGTTDSIDYTIFGNNNGATTLYINQIGSEGDNTSIESARTASTFTITEYAASAVTLT